MHQLRQPLRAPRSRCPLRHLQLRQWQGRASDVAHRQARGRRHEPAGVGRGALAGDWRLLRWRLPLARPLTFDPLLAGRLGAALSIVPDEPGLYWASVAVILAPAPESVLVIRRAHRDGDPWSGHMALPGGRREPGDDDLLATVIRETEEEVGVALPRAALLGVLDDVVPRTRVLPPIAVRPFVFRLEGRPRLELNAEVAAADWLGLGDLRAQWRAAVQVEVAGVPRSTPAFVTSEGVVWGMTERILRDLLDRIEPGDR
jgi:8-oxo-dGTP pyrophosphatase MutT (NUDIX family)